MSLLFDLYNHFKKRNLSSDPRLGKCQGLDERDVKEISQAVDS
jgi:hypothetical protein